MRLHHLVALACCLALALVLAAPAAGDSLVFIRENNVWLSNTDGSGQYQVTFDGSAGSPYESPSQSDGGTIVAIRRPPGQRNQIFRMTQSGGLLNPPINTPAPGPAGAIDSKVSPDGKLVAYWFTTFVGTGECLFCVEVAASVLISHSDRFTGYEEVGWPHTGIEPSWINNSTLVLPNSNGTLWYYAVGEKEGQMWFENTGLFQPPDKGGISQLIAGAEVAPSGDRMVVVYGDSGQYLSMATLSGPPPAPPTVGQGCFEADASTGKFVDPTFSSTGSQLFWQEDTGVWRGSIASSEDCHTNSSPTLLIPGAKEPDASPAADSPGPRPGCGNPGNPAACGPPPPPPPCTTCSTNGGPSAAVIQAAVAGFLKSLSKGLTKAKLHGLRRSHHVSVSFKAPSAGTLTAQLSVRAGHANVVLASGRHVFGSASSSALSLALTSNGKKRLAKVHSLRCTLTVAFTPAGAHQATSLKTSLTLR